MKKLSIIVLATSALFSSISFADMEEKHHSEHKAEMAEKKGKMKEICKNNKEKCKAIKELKSKHKAEMDSLINS